MVFYMIMRRKYGSVEGEFFPLSVSLISLKYIGNVVTRVQRLELAL